MRRLDIDARLVAAGLLAAAMALIVLFLTAPPERTGVLVAATEVPAGVPLGELLVDTRLVEDTTGLVEEASLDDLVGHVLAAPLDAGAPIPASLLVDADAKGVDLLGLDLPGAAAVHGRLEPGDRIDAYRMSDPVGLVAADLPVVVVDQVDSALGTGEVALVVAVDADIAPALIDAGRDGIHVVRVGE